VGFKAIYIDHAGSTSYKTPKSLTSALSAVRPSLETMSRARRAIAVPTTNNNAKTHETILFWSLFDFLSDFARSRLLGIIRNRKRLIEALLRAVII